MKDKSLFQSTRSSKTVASAPEAILSGIAPDGGLFVPAELPHADVRRILSLDPLPMAAAILHIMLPSFSEEQLLPLVT
ncbi:MAG: threonine synthase, partial [Clostridia bacterium]|nr:threonine synthase [Clostridia bacterium]